MKPELGVGVVLLFWNASAWAQADPPTGASDDAPILRRMDRGTTPVLPAAPSREALGRTLDVDGRKEVSQDLASSAFARFGPCTATHVGRGYFLSAGHCVSNVPGFEGFRTVPCPAPLTLFDGTQMKCRVVSYAFDRNRDYAVLEADDPGLADRLALHPIDYGFDWARDNKRSLRLYGLSKDKLRVNDACTGSYQSWRRRIVHDCDTEGGDSGSALVDRNTGHIVGIHGGTLNKTHNYGWPIAQVPWAESICVAVTTSERLPIIPGAAPATLRVSTSHLPGGFNRMRVELRGSLRRPDVTVQVLAPDSDIALTWRDLRWSSYTRFSYDEIFVLDRHRAGPWSVEVGSSARQNQQWRKGYVEGRVWVCP